MSLDVVKDSFTVVSVLICVEFPACFLRGGEVFALLDSFDDFVPVMANTAFNLVVIVKVKRAHGLVFLYVEGSKDDGLPCEQEIKINARIVGDEQIHVFQECVRILIFIGRKDDETLTVAGNVDKTVVVMAFV